MLDWLTNPLAPNSETRLPLEVLASQVGIAVIAGFIVAGIFRSTIVSRDRSAALLTTLILLTVLTSIVTLVIGSNVARAFGLVGALSIVRFRTVVEDTRETSFVIFAVVVGMAVGANYVVLAMVAMIAVAFVATIMRWFVPSGRFHTTSKLLLSLRIPVGQDRTPLQNLLTKNCLSHRAVGVATAKQGAAIELTYGLRMSADPEAMMKLVEELTRLEGVQGIDLKENSKTIP